MHGDDTAVQGDMPGSLQTHALCCNVSAPTLRPGICSTELLWKKGLCKLLWVVRDGWS